MKKKIKKHPKEMTADEAIKHVFHPDALKHVKRHLERISEKKKKGSKDENK